MKEKRFTCPFTGCEFSAPTDAFGSIYAKHPLTGKDFRATYDPKTNSFMIPAELFAHVLYVSQSDAADFLGVSRQRVNAIAAKNVITPRIVNGQTVFRFDDVLKYKDTKKVGAPKKVI